MSEGGINCGTRTTLLRNQRKARNAGKADLDHIVAMGLEGFQKMKQAQNASKKETENKSTEATTPSGSEPSGTKRKADSQQKDEETAQQKDGETAEANKPVTLPFV